MGTAYDADDAARDTGSSSDDVGGAWHNARNDAVGDDRYEGRNEKEDYVDRDPNWYTSDEDWQASFLSYGWGVKHLTPLQTTSRICL